MSESPYGLIWPHGAAAVRHARHGPPAPELGVVNEARVVGEAGGASRPGRQRRARAAQPRADARLLGHAGGDGRGLMDDGWLRTGDLVTVARGRHLHLRVPGQGGHPAPRREPVAAGGRGRARQRTRRCWSAPSSGVPSELSEEEVKAFIVPAAGARARLRRAARVRGRPARGVQGAAVLAADRRAAADADRAGGQAPAARSATRPASTTPAGRCRDPRDTMRQPHSGESSD